MNDDHPDAQSQIDECVARLKSKIPPMEHDALDSRIGELINDSSILRQEFDPEHN